MGTGNESPLFRTFVEETLQSRGWTARDLARAVGTDAVSVSRWLNGIQPRQHMVSRVAERLGMDEDELLHMAGYQRRQPESPAGESPEHRALIEKLRQVPLTRDRFLMLDALFDHLRQTPP